MKLIRINRGALLIAAILGTGLVGTATAKVSPDEAAELGKSLTPMGAEKAGNQDGSIPAYTGKWLGVPAHVDYKPGEAYPDPYSEEKPLFVITAENMEQYADRLADGAKAMFRRYPDTYRMPVYPSHRDFRYLPVVEEVVKANALSAELADDGLTVNHLRGGIAFPIPQSGLELIWNHNSATQAWTENGRYDRATVFGDGSIAWGQQDRRILQPWNNPNASAEDRQALVNTYFQEVTITPVREKGEIITGWVNWSFTTANNMQTYQYNPATRRVRQLPQWGFDMPTGPGGIRTVDDDRMFNGSPERYDWKILGKREIYIPYHNYRIDDRSVKYDTLLTKNHINPDYMRYELHRVWVVEATVKQNVRHLYPRRVLYIDEDQWQVILAESYDAQGALWRYNQMATVYAYDANSFFPRVGLYHDLLAGSYFADRLINEASRVPKIGAGDLKASDFTPDAIRRMGN